MLKASKVRRRIRRLMFAAGSLLAAAAALALADPGPTQSIPKETVRIIDVADNLLESGKIFAEGRIEGCFRMKKACERTIFDRARCPARFRNT